MNRVVFTMGLTFLASVECFAVLELQMNHLVHETCNYANGQIWVSGVGGTPPYTYSWSDGPTSPQREGLSAGNYTVTVTDASLDQASLSIDVLSSPYEITANASGLPWCFAPGNGFQDPMASGMPSTWTVNGQPTGISGGGYITFDPYPWDVSFTYTVDDGNGCSGTITGINGPQIASWPELSVISVLPSCTTESIGAIHILSAGPAPTGSPFGPWVNLVDAEGGFMYQTYQPDPGTFELSFEDLAPGTYGIHWWLGATAEDLDPGECGHDTLWVTVPNIGNACGSVQGTSFIDLDGDCAQDANEAGVPYSPLLVQPGDLALLTDEDGQFDFGLPNGNYSLEQTDVSLVPICPATQPVSFTVNTNVTTLSLANGSTEPLDLRASISGGVFRPGFNTSYHVMVMNDSPQQSGPVTVTLDLDPVLTYVTSSVAPVINGSTLTWTLPAFTSYQLEHWHVTVNVPVGTPLGTLLSSILTVSNTLPDANAGNNTDIDNDIVVGSYDPNDKRATTSSRASESFYFINEDEWIDYTIRFQNTGTFPAEFVVITDTIAHELDMLTFEQGVASHPFTVSFKPGRVIEWRFDNIQLPDSTSDEPGSHGLVKFRMKPRLPLVAGALIENIANIYFDFNEPVITEPSVLTAEFSTAVRTEELAGTLTLENGPSSVRVVLRGSTTAGAMVQLLAMDGRQVASVRATGNTAFFDHSGLARGVYVVDWMDRAGRSVRCRAVLGS